MIFSHLQAEDRAYEAGADAFLEKPLNEELLIETLQKLLDIAKAFSRRGRLMPRKDPDRVRDSTRCCTAVFR